MRHLARLVTGLMLGQGIHLSQIARAGPYLLPPVPRQVPQLRRFLDNPRVGVKAGSDRCGGDGYRGAAPAP